MCEFFCCVPIKKGHYHEEITQESFGRHGWRCGGGGGGYMGGVRNLGRDEKRRPGRQAGRQAVRD